LAIEAGNLETLSSVVKFVLWAVVAAFMMYQLRRAWLSRTSTAAEVAGRWTSILFAVVFVGSSQFYAWYIGIVFPLSLLGAGASRLTDLVVLLSGTHMAFNFLRGKAIGYFLVTTAIPVIYVIWSRLRESQSGPLLASGLSVGKTMEGSITSVRR
jgi:hypothetical protein